MSVSPAFGLQTQSSPSPIGEQGSNDNLHCPPAVEVPIRLTACDPITRRGEPITCGLPWPRGRVNSTTQFRLIGPGEKPASIQPRPLEYWPDGSIRWCLFDFQASTDRELGSYRIAVEESSSPGRAPDVVDPLRGEIDAGGLRVAVGCRSSSGPLLMAVRGPGPRAPIAVSFTCLLTDDGGRERSVTPEFSAGLLERGPIRWRIQIRSESMPDGLLAFGHIDLFAGSPVVRVQLTLRNTQHAGHPGGNWDLGNAGSVLLRDVAVTVQLPAANGETRVHCSPEPGRPLEPVGDRVELYQDSSGGENWNHRNHLNRHRVVPHRFRGYRMSVGEHSREGLRATPIVTVERGDCFLGATMSQFWENFPKAIEADENGLGLRLFPQQSGSLHELQGGEQKTHVFYLAFGRDAVTEVPMEWCRSPLLAHADPEWYAEAGAIPYLTPSKDDPNRDYLSLVNQAIEGPDTFFHKREVIDEYGWRNFGDVYADHESIFHQGLEPFVSHYNNQFDVVYGCGVQFLRSADPRWWDLFIPAADHTCDIDIYHTDNDKPAYNRGLFWPTFHYNDADTGTHRSYPRALRTRSDVIPGRSLATMGEAGAKIQRLYAGGVGGGPSANHNYNLGLMLAYFLTGNPIYRDTAIDLARFVVAMDAPRLILRPLSTEYTGHATASQGDDYHGPGRASGNSILALVVGHRLTGERQFLDKAEQLIRRTCHPKQDLEALDLLNAELRWFYTMHLQALGHYLDYKGELGEHDRMFAYARETLLHYAHWMAANERPVLDHPEKLQYPTETWAAQEMRKVEVFQYAARYAPAADRERFLERAEWFFRYVERALGEFKTRSFCRPVVLMLTNGWTRAWWQQGERVGAAVLASADVEPPAEWRPFIPQKLRARQRFKLATAAGLAAVVLLVVLALTRGLAG